MDEDEFGDLYTDVLGSFPPPRHPLVIPQSKSDADSPNSNFTSFQNPQPPPLLEVPNPNSNLANLVQEQEDEEDSGILIPGLRASATPTINDNTESSSDSDDDLQIVLNDTDPLPILHDGDAHDDHNPLIIMADDTTAAADAPDWGDDDPAALGKDPSDAAAAKPPNAPAHPRTNYPPYHSFHSQFKYVRPGAELLPTASPANVRPPVSISLLAGRGRGDLRPSGLKGPPLNKGFHPAYWAGSAPPRGLEFTLPSHKSIFDVDIDNFEEKPWKYPSVDVSDFFNFSLNEESWKDYCRQLEQLRLESTMQSKIRVYESGRAEQEFDPDLPPELAAASAINDSLAENTDVAKGDGGLGDPAKGASRRPLLPTGRAIQVETGYGERLPSADTRPPRVRDSDAVIEIVLQDSVDDESTGNSDTANLDNDSGREDEHMDAVNEDDPVGEDKDFDGFPHRDVTIEDVTKQRSPLTSSPPSDVHDKERERSSPERALSDHHSDSKVHDSTENVGSPCKKRWTEETAREISSHKSSDASSHERRSPGYQKEDSADSMEQKRSPESLSIACVGGAEEASVEGKMADDDIATDNKSRKEKEDSDVAGSIEASNNKRRIHSTKQQKMSRPSEPSASKDVDDGDDGDSSRRNGNSKTTANCRDHQKWREGIEQEIKQNGRPVYMSDVKRHRGGAHDSRKKDFDGRMEVDMDYVSTKGREDYYCHKEWDPSTGNHFHVKPDDVDWRRDRDYSEARWQRRDEDPHGRRTKAEDSRKQERGDEIVSRHRRKVNEIGRSDKDEYLQPPKKLENGSWRSYHEKDAGLRYREKDDVSKSRHEILDDHHSKRRKDDNFMRRDHVDNQDTSLGVRESSGTHGKRDKDGVLNQRKRDDHPRVRDTYENHHAVRLKDEVWMQRERAEQQRDRDEWYRSKQSYEENLSRKDRGEGHVITRNSRSIKEKVLAGHSHGREEYKSHDKDGEWHSEQLKRRERLEEETSLQHRGSEGVYARGNQTVSEGKRPRQEKSASRNDRVVSASDNQKFLQEKFRDKYKKAKESESRSISGTLKRHQGEKDMANDTADVKGLSEKPVAENDTSLHNLSREGVSSDDEQQDSRRGRSKLERWASHKDGDRDSRSKSSSLKIKEMSKNRIASGSTTVVREESEKNDEVEDSNQGLAAVKESGGGSEVKDVEAKATNYRREDTVEKLKKRKERFKLQLASEKDPSAIKELENESIPSSHNETPVNAEVKQERPPRKRRWLSS